LRLTHLKLAGFKSFVDPTTLHIHGQRVGVVGPNGCGKSNVMESIRWVLGESSAREMRGDSMSDVIFNGSGNRKPVSRASVELIFDNSLGGANGEWSQYAEIAVKRVLEREKGSSYYINNTVVRRRDVADLFLGTGLGGRAYAIIGQNTISRIVEAKPEELRVFLEEAAGISKYKERRRETELRLRDTRENLTRVEDIRRELDKQINRLASQAEVTEQYHRLQDTLKHAQGQLWLIKKRDASMAWEKNQRQVEKLVNELEAQMAALRKAETALETLRQQHYTSTEAVQAAQTKYYEANAEVSNLEQQVKHTQEARERLTSQLQQLNAQSQRIESQTAQLQENLQQLNLQHQEASVGETQAEQDLQVFRLSLPKAEQEYSLAQSSHAAAQSALSETEQNIRLETSNLDHLNRTIVELEQRLHKLEQEQSQLQLPNAGELEQKRVAHEQAQLELTKLEKSLVDLHRQEQQYIEQIKLMRESQLQEERVIAQIQAQIVSLSKIQQSLGQEAKLDAWLNTTGLKDNKRLWQTISIATGWETSLEAVLGAKLNAIFKPQAVNELAYKQRPPAALVICSPGADKPMVGGGSLKPLLSIVSEIETGTAGLMWDWLAGVYLLDDDADPMLIRKQLKPGEILVNKLGDIYSNHSVAFYAAQSALHGVLERQRELADLQARLPELQENLSSQTKSLNDTELTLQQARDSYQQQQQILKSNTQSQHGLSLEIQRLQQQHQHVLARQKTLQAEQQSTSQSLDKLKSEQMAKQQALEALRSLLNGLQSHRDEAQTARQAKELTLNNTRMELQKAERHAQEKIFNNKIITNNINEINSKINLFYEEKQALIVRRNEAETMLEAAKMEGLQTNLQTALSAKQQSEAELASTRNAMASAEQELQAQERSRMQNEQLLHPLRDKLEQSRLQEQQARLHFEQCQAALLATGLDETVLADNLLPSTKATEIERSTSELEAQIAELGPVNLAAIQELHSERERKAYLDSQAADLEQAITTLEDAIRRIDKETRNRLQNTFDEANRHFGELFSILFGGGQARLELLGEEILDTGMQVFAQPPGKKNSTIHLLSGGEKALTALALVFALFRLNPAPFCLMDEVDAPLDDSNTERFCNMVKKMSEHTQFLFVSHNKITMEMAQQLIGVTMQESGVSRIVEVDIEAALKMNGELNSEVMV
jgi:chromosome segregation protein